EAALLAHLRRRGRERRLGIGATLRDHQTQYEAKDHPQGSLRDLHVRIPPRGVLPRSQETRRACASLLLRTGPRSPSTKLLIEVPFGTRPARLTDSMDSPISSSLSSATVAQAAAASDGARPR